jgi:diaminopimelate decarboxylase
MEHLMWGGCDLTELAYRFGTPLYVMDESMIRDRCRALCAAVSGRGARICYAGKAFLNLAMIRLVDEEGLGLDVVSEGELSLACRAGFPMERVTLHGNAKSERFLRAGLKNRVGTLVVDSEDELELLAALSEAMQIRQKILFRVSPGIEAHTLRQIQTAQLDCKFGVPMAHLKRAVARAMACPWLDLAGLHVHVGSQIRDMDAHLAAAEIMTGLLRDLGDSLGFEARELDLGGGFGIPELPGDSPVPAEVFVGKILDRVDRRCAALELKRPEVIFEPGRWIVGEAGVILYTVVSVKEIPGVRTYVAVDGGMTDNPRPQLYGARYEVRLASDTRRPVTKRAAIAGPCCETGDVLTMDAAVPELHRGDVLAVPLTGAYCFSMFCGYNCMPRPAVVFARGGKAREVVRRQTLDDLAAGQI